MKKIRFLLAFLVVLYLLGYPFIYFLQELFLFRPVALPADFKYHFDEPFEEFDLRPQAGVRLNGLVFKTNAKHRGVVIYFHGNADNLTRWGKNAARFTRNGYDVWMYDYRRFGKSTGAWSEQGFYDDAEHVYQQVLKRYPESQVVLYGFSLGTGLATKLAADHQPRLLLLEAPYYSFASLCWMHAPIYPYETMLSYQFKTNERIARVRCPIQLFHGTADGVVKYRSSLMLADVLQKTPAQILTTVPGGKHKNLADFDLYHTELDKFLK